MCCNTLLDTRHRLIRTEYLFRRTIDGASVHPREVVRVALDANAAAAVLFHNHPSGVAEPSRADEFITSQLRNALGLIGVAILDHLIIAGTHHYSFAQAGLI